MKTVILTLIGLGLCVQAQSENLSTTDGATYNNITSRRVEPDGLYVEYTPSGGGLGMAKIKFARLSPEQQKEYGYDADKAKDFETRVAKANDDWRQDMIRSEQTAKAEQQAEQAREDQSEQAATGRIIAVAQLKQAEADLARSQNGADYGAASFGGGYGAVAIPEINVGNHVQARTRSFDTTPFVGRDPVLLPHQQTSRR
jgi:hypothetical protein